MNRLFSISNVAAITLVACGLLASGNVAQADHDHGFDGGFSQPGLYGPTCQHDYIPPCQYRTVIEYELRPVQYTECVTRYRPCGHPYTVHVTRTKWIRVPVERLVKVCY